MIRILHTADWHIGQLFHEYDRSYEHRQFLDWLAMALREENIDVLLISGDVFDQANPSAASLKLFYSFLNQSTRENPHLQIIVTAGNHDSASRLESPKPLLESSKIHIVGVIEKDVNGEADYSKITFPLKNRQGNTQAWCIAVPFLRLGDYPSIPEADNPYAEGVATFYKNAFHYAETLKTRDQAIIAMGHLHAQQAEIGDADKMERLIMGGVESISAAAFHPDLRYVALGHIHKAQRVGGNEHIRYSGSPIPMSFSETNYKHQVVIFDIEGDSVKDIRIKEVPVAVPLCRVPSAHSSIAEVISALEWMDPFHGEQRSAPYLEVKILLDGPAPGLRHRIETALEGKNYRLAKIDVKYSSSPTLSSHDTPKHLEQLNNLKPMDVLSQTYSKKYGNSLPDELQKLFQQVLLEVNEVDNE